LCAGDLLSGSHDRIDLADATAGSAAEASLDVARTLLRRAYVVPA
jgi:hypothetical protein